MVAPARERGLKWTPTGVLLTLKLRRSREGAWIEIWLHGQIKHAV